MENTKVTPETENDMNFGVCIKRSPEFFRAAQTLSNFIKDLPNDQPTNDQPTNDQLVALRVPHWIIILENKSQKAILARRMQLSFGISGGRKVVHYG